MIENQKNQRGGRREGAGRKPGSSNRPRLSSQLSLKEKELLVTTALARALQGNDLLLKFMLEQIYGKAPQNVEADVRGELLLTISKEIADKNE